MADIKISQLGTAIAVSDSDLVPIVSSGSTLKASASLVKEYAVGNTDLTGLGDGTPTGAIAALNTAKQPKTLDTPLTIGGAQKTTVEAALGGLNSESESLKQALTNKQDQTLATPTTIDNVSRTTVQDALTALNDSNRVVNSLTGLSTTKSLSARQGKNISDSVTSIKTTNSVNDTGSTIRVGRYFYLNGILCRALTSIFPNAQFTLNTNYEEVDDGGLNSIIQTHFLNVSANVAKNSSKTISIGNSQQGFIFLSGQVGEVCALISFTCDSGGYVARAIYSSGIYTGDIAITTGTNSLTVQNNSSSYGTQLAVIGFNPNSSLEII